METYMYVWYVCGYTQHPSTRAMLCGRSLSTQSRMSIHGKDGNNFVPPAA